MNLQRFKNIGSNPRYKHRLLALGYATAVTFAFVLSLTNNNSVKASVSRTDKFDYLMLENTIQEGSVLPEVIYPENSVENIKSLYDMVNYGNREKTVDNETCVKCLKCIGTCRQNAIKYGIKPKEEVKFIVSRRKLIWTGAAFVVLAGAVKAGLELGEKAAEKIRNIILPPGAVNANRMYNKCLNCNLCIENCPNKILAKANDKFGAVHIDYAKGEGFCKYDCNKCSQVCPSGAIKKITKEEKQKTRIAMASINQEKCTQCGICVYDCPAGAISKQGKKTVIDASKCIGCGRCKKSCRFDAIEIFAINEQTVI